MGRAAAAMLVLLVLAAVAPRAGGAAALALGDRALAAGRYGDAGEAYGWADRFRPDSPEPPRRLGELELTRNRPEPAAAWYAEALRREPADTAAKIGQARVSLARGHAANAAAEAETVARAAGQAPATTAEAWWVVARARLAERDADGAVGAARNALDLAEAAEPTPAWTAEATYRLGTLLAGRDAAEAAARLRRTAASAAFGAAARSAMDDLAAIERAPTPDDRDVALAELWVRHDLPWLALAPLERFTADRPERPQPWLLLGAARLQLDDAAGAATALQQAVEIEPDSAAAHVLLGVARRGEGDLPASAAALRRARDLDPTNPAIPRELARTYSRAAAWPAAEEALAEAAALEPRRLDGHLELVRFQLDHLYALDRAVDRARAAADLDPASADAADLLGWAAYLTGDLNTAREQLRRALTLRPTHAAARYHLAVLLDRTGDRAGADREYLAARELDTSTRYLNLATQALAARR